MKIKKLLQRFSPFRIALFLLVFISMIYSESSMLVEDIMQGSEGSYPKHFIEANGTLYFSATNGWLNHGYELWKYDRINAPEMVKDINFGGSSSRPESFITFNGKLYFFFCWLCIASMLLVTIVKKI